MGLCNSSNTYLNRDSPKLNNHGLMNLSEDCWTPATSSANVFAVSNNR